jgi:uncharacterized protein involved in outer membrane biogenesis
MKASGKVVKTVLTIIVIIVVLLALSVYFFGAQALRAGISAGASKALKVNVGLGGVSLGLLRGQIGISNLVIDNPPGYSDKTLLNLGSASVRAQIGSLLSDTVKIDEIRLDGIDLVIEQKGLSTNLKDLLDNVASGKPAEPAGTGDKKTAGKNLQIKNLEITNVSVRVKVLGGPEVPLKLEAIRMENIGTGEKVSIATLTGKILVAIATSVAQQGAGLIPGDITGGLKAGLENVQKIGGSILEQGKGVLEKGVESGAGVGEAIKGLFEKKK